jgi:predicted metal-binding membrane protein
MNTMPMAGGWEMSMAWMRMPGQTWAGAAASFLGMWIVMMTAMMLPSLVLMLWRYREAIAGTGETRHGWPTALAGLGYLFVWTMVGLAVFPVGAALGAIVMHQPAVSRVVPIAIGTIVLIAGSFQFTSLKARGLACCRAALRRGHSSSADSEVAWQHGARLGLECARCCGNLMAILVVTGIMNLQVMAVVTAAIMFERLAPAGERAARIIGTIVVGAGLILIARGAGSG